VTRASDRGERVFRALLRLYPRRFRDRFMDEMVDFFRARRDEQRHRYGARGIARLWMHLVADIAVNAPLQHMRALRPLSAHDLPWASPEYPQETHPMDTLRQDLRYALRSLVRHPAFAIVAGLTLALGIGANTAIFSVVDAVLLRPLPWPDSDRLVIVYGTRGENQQGGVAYPDYLDWREQNRSFDALGIIRGQSINLTGRESPDRLFGTFVTASALRMLGASALHGRLFSDAETEVATKEPVAVVNESAWRTRFGSRTDLVGATLVLNGQPFTVVGIMRPGFEQPLGTPDVWLPLGYYPNRGDLETRGRGGVLAFGKLKPMVSIKRAQDDLDVITARLATLHPATNAGVGANVSSLREEIVGPSRTPLLVVLGAVTTVLLIACANVANLQLARATARRRVLSVRAALGAGRSRLMRQLLTESFVLSVVGGLAGLGIAYLGVRWLAAVVPLQVVLFGEISLSGGVLLFAALLTLGTGIVFGIAPAWQASRSQLQETLTVRGESAVVKLGARSALVVGQIALCVVLLVCAGLLTRSLIAISQVRPGFDADRLLTLQFRLPPTKYDSEEKIAGMFTRTIAEIRSVPGVEAAALARATPLNGNGEQVTYALQGSDVTDAAKLPQAHRNIVSPGYFETMRIPRLDGRDFTEADRLGTSPVVIVNEQLARKVAPRGSAVGKQVQVSFADEPIWATIVGVVGNAKHFRLNEMQRDQVYMSVGQLPLIFTEVVVRTTSEDPMTVANAVRGAIWRVDRDQPVWRIRPVTQSIEGQLGARKFTMRLLASFAILAVVLATIGVYGVMSYAVARRTQEMGIRMALGARATQVVGMILKQGMRTVALAVAIGLVAALFATRVLETQLFGIERTDPITFAVVSLGLAGIALLACYLPARRASKVDPLVALRAD
jgi:putative ABC transport system permease protein